MYRLTISEGAMSITKCFFYTSSQKEFRKKFKKECKEHRLRYKALMVFVERFFDTGVYNIRMNIDYFPEEFKKEVK